VNLRPTSKPLTVKEFDREACGICAGCGCSCGYIAYFREGKLVDLYGHPSDPNGMGSFCTKGITYIQQLPDNPLRLRKPLLREGDSLKEIDNRKALEIFRDHFRGRRAIFLSRDCDLTDTGAAIASGAEIFTDGVYLPFRPSTLSPQDWPQQRFILSFECEPVFSEVMSTRWIVDAFEASAHIISLSSLFATISAKATERFLLSPPRIVMFIRSLADALEGKQPAFMGEEVSRIARSLSLIPQSLILLGDLLFHYPWKNAVLDALRRIRRRVRVNYSVLGDVHPVRSGSLYDFLGRLEEFDSILITGNPFLWADDSLLEKIKKVRKIYLGLFPNITALNSDLLLPAKAFAERDFLIFRNGFGIRENAPAVLEGEEGYLTVARILGAEPSGIPDPRELPLIEDWDEDLEVEEVEEGELWLVAGRGLVEDLGHWNPWTHAIEREQRALISPKTASRFGMGEWLDAGGERIKLEVSSNVAEGVIYVPDSFEEFQPFDPGVRIGKILGSPARRAGLYRLK